MLDQEFIIKALRSQEVETLYIEVIKNMYSNCQARILLVEPGPFFPERKGLRQEDPLSPISFNCSLEEISDN